MLDFFFIDNIFGMFCECVFQQTIGIPMGISMGIRISLSFFDLRILVTPLLSSNSAKLLHYFKNCPLRLIRRQMFVLVYKFTALARRFPRRTEKQIQISV